MLARTINDKVENTTRFLVLRRKTPHTASRVVPGPTDTARVDHGSWKSLVSFTLDHANPGALAGCLEAFSKEGVNLTSINTRPSGVENWNYVFFVELKGRKEAFAGGEGNVDRALRELEKGCRGYRWLGSWENRLVEG